MQRSRQPTMLRCTLLSCLACLLVSMITNLAVGRAMFDSVWGWIGYFLMIHGMLSFLEQALRFLAPPKSEPSRRDWYSEAMAREPGGSFKP